MAPVTQTDNALFVYALTNITTGLKVTAMTGDHVGGLHRYRNAPG